MVIMAQEDILREMIECIGLVERIETLLLLDHPPRLRVNWRDHLAGDFPLE